MEKLQYVIEDSTIAELLGVQNFNNDESAVLELVKNAYDAQSSYVSIRFESDRITIEDAGCGMNAQDIRESWMHIGKSDKGYKVSDEDGHERVLAGSKGIGRFALSRLGRQADIVSQKKGCEGIHWFTDWNHSFLETNNSLQATGTKIVIADLRERWNRKKALNLVDFLSKACNDQTMKIQIVHPDAPDGHWDIHPRFQRAEIGVNCLSRISLSYASSSQTLRIRIDSDEFTEEAVSYCADMNLNPNHFQSDINMADELKGPEREILDEDLEEYLKNIGDFSADFFFTISPSKEDAEKFLYKRFKPGAPLPDSLPGGVILYRNAFSISSYDGKKDWIGLGKRSRQSPAAASHPTGAWRVRENQIAGKVLIDKQKNAVLQDLSNRQGIDENIYYELFVQILLTGLREFERYRQSIVRCVNKKNEQARPSVKAPISDKVISNPKSVATLTAHEGMQLASEIKDSRKRIKEAEKEKVDVENRYKYDIRILNVLATSGLKASSIAHEMNNDRSNIACNTQFVIDALQEYGMWDELNEPEKTEILCKNVPELLNRNQKVSHKILLFMDTMLSELERKQFKPSMKNVTDILHSIADRWMCDYAWVKIEIESRKDIQFYISDDVLSVIFDNLILNSIQQNDESSHLNIIISAEQGNHVLFFSYADDGKGLDPKYYDHPAKIVEVLETTRKEDGHGLGMWIVNNTVVMSGSPAITDKDIDGQNGFRIRFSIGGALNGDYEPSVY